MNNYDDINYRWGQDFINLIKEKVKKSKCKTKDIMIDGLVRDYDWIIYHLCQYFTDYNMDHLRDMSIKKFKQQYQFFTIYFKEQSQEDQQDQYEELININNASKYKENKRRYGRLYTSL